MIDDKTFIHDLLASQESVWLTAQWLHKRGYNVHVPPLHIRPSRNQIDQYSDHGDLFVQERIEVKHRPNLHFTCPKDYPFATVIVDTARSWERANPKPQAYIVWNSDYTAFLVVGRWTAKHWKKTTKHDRRAGNRRTFYECPVQYCQFYRPD